jgi:hypothetical protein
VPHLLVPERSVPGKRAANQGRQCPDACYEIGGKKTDNGSIKKQPAVLIRFNRGDGIVDHPHVSVVISCPGRVCVFHTIKRMTGALKLSGKQISKDRFSSANGTNQDD